MAITILTITLLLLCSTALVFAIPVVRRQTKRLNEEIRAEVWATDLMDGVAPAPQEEKPRKYEYRWGRISVFAVGLLSLIAAVITGVLVPLTALAWYIPVILLAVTLGCLGTLRFLAIQDIKKRVKRRPQSKPQLEVSQIVLAKPNHEEAKPAVHASESGAPQVKPIKHRQQKPINYASKSLRYARTHHQDESAEQVTFKKLPGGKIELEQTSFEKPETWDVRETPRPTYLDAAANFREEALPLTIAEPDASESSTLKEAAAKAGGMNLDDVLSRRRAQ